MKINLEEFKKREKYINCQKHPTENLLIWNYKHACQFDKAWDEYTMMARGLITDSNGNIKARPFKKFFNYGEIEDQKFPDEAPVITEKFDGSLGILYWIDDVPHIATRGSFTSEQALWATNHLQKNSVISDFKKDRTYLFEIIYKENRIVVNYDFNGLVHLAQINIETGEQIIHAHLPKVWTDSSHEWIRATEELLPNKDFDIDKLKTKNISNKEGFVFYYPEADLRMKIKFDEYVRLHRIVTGFSTKSIWEALKNKDDIEEILDNVPDEFYQWVKKKKDVLEKRYCNLRDKAKSIKKEAEKLETRKEQAEFIYSQKDGQVLSGAIFALLDGKNYKNRIWKIIKPKYEQPFKTDIDL